MQEKLQRMRDYFNSGITLDVTWRMAMLQKLRTSIQRHEADVLKALRQDFNKPAFETYITELIFTYRELDYQLKHIRKFTKAHRAATGLLNFGSSGRIIAEPYGLVLIMAPWNYPFLLALQPLIGAIAAGNVAVIKPSNYSAQTAQLIMTILTETFPAEYVLTVLGGRQVNTDLLDQRFDMIFFTGSPAVGKLVMAKASAYLTPVILELGGKSPCIIDTEADLKLAAKRIVWGKFLNGGQTCIAVDHVYLPRVHRTQFLALCQEYIQAFYYKDDALSADFCQIINDKHFQRLTALIPKAKVVIGGKTNPNTRMIEPTVIDAVEETDAIMQEEIFGPLLPLIYYDDLDTLLNEMTKRAKPLALYFFSSDPQNIDKVIRLTSSGGVAINDVIMQVSAHQLPFGGVGNSGMGQYHGAATFKAFSHEKSVFRQSALLDMSFRYPPYYTKINLIKWLLPKKD